MYCYSSGSTQLYRRHYETVMLQYRLCHIICLRLCFIVLLFVQYCHISYLSLSLFIKGVKIGWPCSPIVFLKKIYVESNWYNNDRGFNTDFWWREISFTCQHVVENELFITLSVPGLRVTAWVNSFPWHALCANARPEHAEGSCWLTVNGRYGMLGFAGVSKYPAVKELKRIWSSSANSVDSVLCPATKKVNDRTIISIKRYYSGLSIRWPYGHL